MHARDHRMRLVPDEHVHPVVSSQNIVRVTKRGKCYVLRAIPALLIGLLLVLCSAIEAHGSRLRLRRSFQRLLVLDFDTIIVGFTNTSRGRYGKIGRDSYSAAPCLHGARAPILHPWGRSAVAVTGRRCRRVGAS
jgi:hypothetical protein